MANKSMGEMIRLLRIKKEMTQNDLAKKMNITDKAVSKWERNLSYPDIKSIPRLAKVLDTTVEELLNTQVKKEGKPKNEIMNIALIGISLAMGIYILIVSLLKIVDVSEAMLVLGIGVSCLAIYLLKNKKE